MELYTFGGGLLYLPACVPDPSARSMENDPFGKEKMDEGIIIELAYENWTLAIPV